MTVARLAGALALATIALPLRAQEPTIEASVVAMRAQPLPVLDAYGEVISEDLIRATMREKGRRAYVFPIVGALAGALVLGAAWAAPFDCSIYDPCTPKEKFYGDHGPIVGLIAGALIGAAIPDGSVDRPRAVQLLRAQRRTQRELSGIP